VKARAWFPELRTTPRTGIRRFWDGSRLDPKNLKEKRNQKEVEELHCMIIAHTGVRACRVFGGVSPRKEKRSSSAVKLYYVFHVNNVLVQYAEMSEMYEHINCEMGFLI
jgi:hypothetical protein